MDKYLAAAVQTSAGENKKQNVEKALHYAGLAARQGAKLIVLPEVFSYVGKQRAENAEDLCGETVRALQSFAAEFKVFIHGGSIFEKNPGGKPFNTCVFIDDRGGLAGVYRKLHAFDATLPDGRKISESSYSSAGVEIVCVHTDIGSIGLATCYDIRFPEQFRLLRARNAEIFTIGANFTRPTGKAHWEVLLRARAIESGTYVVASDQTGHDEGVPSFGGSMIIDPWGEVKARMGEEEGFCIAEIERELIKKVRTDVPSFDNRRCDVYSLKTNN